MTPTNRGDLVKLVAGAIAFNLGCVAVKPRHLTAAKELLIALEADGVAVVPVIASEEQARPLTRLWLMSDQEVTAGDLALASGYYTETIAASPFRQDPSQSEVKNHG
jgi:hypothetical protein